jgi:ABC-type polar amino acid transport system ATPase subunit
VKSTLVFDQAGDGRFAGTVDGLGFGGGSLTKAGGGTLTIDGTLGSGIRTTISGGALKGMGPLVVGSFNVGFVFQFYNLIPSLTARENVQLVTDIADDPMAPEEALRRVGLAERLDHFPAQLAVQSTQQLVKQPMLLTI